MLRKAKSWLSLSTQRCKPAPGLKSMNGTKGIGLALIVAGVLGLMFSTFSFTKDTHEAKVGPLTLSVAEKQTVNIPLWASIAAIVVGGVLVVVGGKRG